ncbi:MAG: hypothetical protein CMJ18_18435 [Phycisphaeraceae bacterium]|nr:hypothetical protein [Phycisphaeraceae bacterium]
MVDALLTPVFGCGAETLLHLEQDDQERSRRARQLHELRDVWRRRGFMVAWRRLIENAETVPRLAAEITGERRITNYLHLAELLHREESIRHAGPEQLHRWLEQSVADGQRGAELESQLRLETDAEAVQLCTIHHSKGLEYPIVFCPTLWHHYGGHKTPKVVMARKDADGEPIEIPEIDVGSDDFDERVTADRAESDAEDRRLLYVALTRAKHQCIVHWTAATSAHKTALGEFMLEDVGGKTEDARIATSIERWCASRACPGLSTRRVSSALPSTAHYEPTPRPARPLAARRIDRTAVSALARTSFTSLVRSASTLDEPADLDDAATTPTRVPAPADQSLFTLPLADMPSGRRIGELAHRVLEESLDGGRAHGAGLDAATTIVAERLDRHLPRVGLDPAWHDPLAHALATCLTGALPLGGITCRLVDLPPSDLACELHFTLRAGDAGRSFDTSALARALARAERPVVRDYARRAERLETRRIRGLLEGFIDLAFEWDGRWYVVDYKTNLLGPHPEHYSTACLDAVMSEHDYILQCHLYAVALDRMLAQRVRDYDYERDFGGVAYLFVRGFEPGEDPDRGVWFDRPPRAVIDALHAALDGGSAG